MADARYRSIVQHLPNAAVFVLGRDLRYPSADGSALATFLAAAGVPFADPVGHALDEVVSPANRAAAIEMVTSALAGASRRAELARGDRIYDLVVEPLRDDPAAPVESVLLVCFDVTERKRVERAREEAMATAETYRLMVESVRDYAIFQLDREGRVRTWHVGARAIKGYDAAEIIGAHFSIFYLPEERARADRELAEAAHGGRYEEEGWRVRKDGSRFWASVVITALRGPDGAVDGFTKVTRDISERRAHEEAMVAKQAVLEQGLREREVLLQEVHHRVKNNLQVISSLINMQLRRLEDRGARAALEECQARILAIALIHEKLYQTKDYAHVAFADYARSLAAGVFQASGRAQGEVVLELEIADVALGIDRAIPCGLVINELISNALKHAFPDGRAGTVRVELVAVDGGRLRLTVRDDGIGLPPGFAIDRAESLGLQLVHTLAEQLDAVLVVRSDGGAAFELTF